MSDWTSGYVADIGYTYGYYAELNPLRARLPLLASALAVPTGSTSCELGFGQGISVNIHAAAGSSKGHWFANDFNPAQAAFGQSLTAISGAKAQLSDESFAEFCVRDDLPEFDFIGLHGIWSWISDDNRQVIVDFIGHKLKVGGVLYISYNTSPGWAATVPLRQLLTEHSAVMSAPGRNITGRIGDAIAFAERLRDANAAFFRNTPQAAERLKSIQSQPRSYVAHEYFNRDWQPMPFADMARWLAPAKLQFAGSANYLDHLPNINLSPDQQTLLGEIDDANFRETVRDFIVNQQFRRDYWVKGARTLNAAERDAQLLAERVVLVAPRDKVTLKVRGALAEADMSAAIYNPLLELLSHHRPVSIGELLHALAPAGVTLAALVQSLLVLGGKGEVAPAQSPEATAAAAPATRRLNAHLIEQSRTSAEFGFLASPVTGGGLQVGRFNQLFLLARSEGLKEPAQWAAFAWQVISAQGQRLTKEGKVLETVEENQAELLSIAQTFASEHLKVLEALQVA